MSISEYNSRIIHMSFIDKGFKLDGGNYSSFWVFEYIRFAFRYENNNQHNCMKISIQ